ncbi:MAG TPA: pyrroloquinoline quinone biosynthesis protein PqqB [Polyangiaceae bacterium]|nr:pyrroloquinoline quinone biosynthesis protein PqqB [Polyangiaceae bacterium]
MLVRVLGSAAGGGFPQWNCGCSNCVGVRQGTLRATARTQESVAVSSDGDAWFILNVSPEIRQQIEAFPGLHPRALRQTPIAGLVLTNGDLDHCLGVLSLRESQRLVAYATDRVRRGFVDGNVFYRTLQRFEGQFSWQILELAQPQPLRDAEGHASGLSLTALPLPGKPPLHALSSERHPEDNVALRIRDDRTGRVLAYLPGVMGPSALVDEALRGADAVFFDGTFWTSDELVQLGIGTRRAEDMAHWPLSGESGSLEYLKRFPDARRVLIHINNTNPVLREDSRERAELDAAGVQLAYDGMEFSL